MSSSVVMLPETDFRRDCFDEDHVSPIVLSDGQTWFLQQPYLTLEPVFQDGKPVDLKRYFSYTREIASIVDELAAASDDDSVGVVTLTLALGAKLLLRNYDLTDDDLARLLVFDGGADSVRIITEIAAIASGFTL